MVILYRVAHTILTITIIVFCTRTLIDDGVILQYAFSLVSTEILNVYYKKYNNILYVKSRRIHTNVYSTGVIHIIKSCTVWRVRRSRSRKTNQLSAVRNNNTIITTGF